MQPLPWQQNSEIVILSTKIIFSNSYDVCLLNSKKEEANEDFHEFYFLCWHKSKRQDKKLFV